MLNSIIGWMRAPRRTPAPVVEDSLDAFGSEDTPTPLVPASVRFADALKPKGSKALMAQRRMVIIAAAVVALGATAYLLRNWRPFNVEAATASLTIESMPAGAEVFAGGASQGRTPLMLSLTPGEHAFELVLDGRRKPLVAQARAGAAVVHHVDFEARPEPPKKASLSITTEPSKLKVLVDGVERGVSPLTVEEVDAGTHEIQVVSSRGTVKRTVDVEAGESASVIIAGSISSSPSPAATSGPAAGWLAVSSPVTLQVAEGNEIIGTTASAKIMLPAGKHNLVLSNEAIGFSERRAVQLNAGSTASLKVELPNAPLSINAVPWAEVWIDGVRIGETPIGNRLVRAGTHELVFRHPEFGERRQTVTVTLTSRARVSVDMRKPGS